MQKFILKLSQFNNNEDLVPFDFQGTEIELHDFYQDLFAQEQVFDSKVLKSQGTVQRLTDDYFLIMGEVSLEFSKPCSRCTQPALISLRETLKSGASLQLNQLSSEEMYLIKNKEINLLTLISESLLLAMPLTVYCHECLEQEKGVESDSELSCVYSPEPSQSSPFATAFGSLRISQKKLAK